MGAGLAAVGIRVGGRGVGGGGRVEVGGGGGGISVGVSNNRADSVNVGRGRVLVTVTVAPPCAIRSVTRQASRLTQISPTHVQSCSEVNFFKTVVPRASVRTTLQKSSDTG